VPRAEIKYYEVTAKGRVYRYAWRNGPRLRGEPGTPEFVASYNEAVESRKALDTDKFKSIVLRYRAGPFKQLAKSTQSKWQPWIERIGDYFGGLQTSQFDRHDKIRPVIIRWRNKWQDTPRTADYGMQVLSAILSYAVDPAGAIARNPCEGIKRLYSSDRSAILWTAADIAQLKASCSTEVADAVDLAAHTGLRLGDLLKLSWSHIGENAIAITTGKTGAEALIPLYDDLRAVLARIPKRGTTVLTSSRNRPWTVNGFGTSFDRAKNAAGMKGRNLHFHDFRGVAATRFYVAGIAERVIAEIMGWDEQHVSKIIRRYVGRTAATEALIKQLNRDERST
jgi:integrase